MLTNELEADIFPRHIQTNLFSNAYFKGVCYLIMAYFVVFGANQYSVIPAIITLVFAVFHLLFASKIQKLSNQMDGQGKYLPELSAKSIDDVITISEYEPPLVPNMMDQTVFFKKASQEELDEHIEQEMTPPQSMGAMTAERGL